MKELLQKDDKRPESHMIIYSRCFVGVPLFNYEAGILAIITFLAIITQG